MRREFNDREAGRAMSSYKHSSGSRHDDEGSQERRSRGDSEYRFSPSSSTSSFQTYYPPPSDPRRGDSYDPKRSRHYQ